MKTLPLLLGASAALFLLAGRPAGADAPPRYRLTVLPLTFHDFDELSDIRIGGGINNVGQIAGLMTVRSGSLSSQRTAVWQKGHPVRLLDKTVITDDQQPPNRTITFPAAVNANGDVVGGNFYAFSGAYSGGGGAAYLWHGAQMVRLPGFPLDSDSVALGLNDRGEIVGNYAYNPHTPSPADPPPPESVFGDHAFLVHDGHVLTLWPGIARGINGQGQIVGTWDFNGGAARERDRGVLWRDGRLTFLKMQPVAINGRGEIAGNVPVTEETGRACVWRRGRVTLLSKRISHAYALNDQGEVVGERDDDTPDHAGRAALWRGGRAYDLNRCAPRPRGWVLTAALGINGKGWIIGEGSLPRSPADRRPPGRFTFLLTPR